MAGLETNQYTCVHRLGAPVKSFHDYMNRQIPEIRTYWGNRPPSQEFLDYCINIRKVLLILEAR